jgi:hypothetical protein
VPSDSVSRVPILLRKRQGFFSGSVRDALAACLPSQEAFELSSLGHSVLTYTRLRPEAGVLPAYSESPTEVAALPGLATLAVALAGAMAIGDVRQAGTAPTDSAMLLDAAPLMMAGVLIIELLAVVALLCILAWQSEARGRHILRPAVVLWGTTAFGAVHLTPESIIMTRLSRWNLGFGYLTVTTITISAILTVIMTLRPPRRWVDEPPEDHRAGSLTLA